LTYCFFFGYAVYREPTNERSVVVTRMQDLASEFHKFSGVILRTSQRKRATPSRPAPTPSPAFCRTRGASAPVLGPKPWSPSTFLPWLRPCLQASSTVSIEHTEQLECQFVYLPNSRSRDQDSQIPRLENGQWLHFR